MTTPMIRRILTVSVTAVMLAGAPRAGAVERLVSSTAYDAAVGDALAVAAQRSDLSVVRVYGQSMLPYFGEEAVIVMKKIDAARLRVGMIAIYVNRFGETVAHRVIARIGDGWRVQGYNNSGPDSTVVNQGNLLGIVYATFHSAGRPPVAVAAGASSAVQTVYAAPAK